MNQIAKLLKGKRFYCFLTSLILSLVLSRTMVYASSIKTYHEQAKTVESFIDSIGVVAHVGFNETVYGNYEKIIKPRLQELGIKHIRTSLHTLKNGKAIQRVNDLADIGIKSLLVAKPHNLSAEESLEVIKAQIKGVEAVEGPNEWNILPHLKYKGESFPQGVTKFQNEFYQAVKNDPQTNHLSVLAPSLARNSQYAKDITDLGKLSCDINNMHSYPGGRMPNLKSLDKQHIPQNKKVCGTQKPIIATETGYHNASLHPNGISEVAAAKYINRLFLEYFNRGVKRTYTYELIDIKPDSSKKVRKYNWGLLRIDGSRKKDYRALRQFLAILRDSDGNGGAVSTNSEIPSNTFSYSLKGKDGNFNNIHHTLLQQDNGTFYLMLWQEVDSYDRENKKDVKVPDRGMVFIPDSAIAQVNVYRPFGSQHSFKTWHHPKKVHFRVPDHPVVLEIIPQTLYAD